MNVTVTTQLAAAAPALSGDAPRKTGNSGNSLPPAGNSAPDTNHSPPSVSVENALEQIRSFLQDSQRQLNFQRDESTGRTVIKVIDQASGEVIRQMPSEEVLKLAAIIDAQGFHVLNELA